jgi:hypothetical protein
MAKRKALPADVTTKTLVDSARRCALCFGLESDLTFKAGQIAHSDRNPNNNRESNLVYLCLNHHDQYDSTTRLSKGITRPELLEYKKRLLAAIAKRRLLEPGQFDIENITQNAVEQFSAFSKSLASLAVAANDWIPLSGEGAIEECLEEPEARVMCLLGEPGCGKTSVLARLVQARVRAGRATLAIRADAIPVDVSLQEWIQSRLQLMQPVLEVIQLVALEQPLVVVIDQLDAVADLADLKSNRLNDLLAFVAAVSRMRGVKLVCSCREFEFRHDARLATLDAREIRLELPAWEQIAQKLAAAGVENAAGWPEELQKALRNPQYLTIFLERVRDSGSKSLPGSYQLMLDEIWSNRIRTEEQREFIYRLTKELVKRESLRAPAVRFESDLAIIRQLEALHVLVMEDGHVRFRHQTLLEHAKARLFIRTEQSLCEYVLDRQDAMWVRPTLWAVLAYLRQVDPEMYRAELSELLNAQLRMHLRYLLIDFLGQVSNPTDLEILHLVGFLDRDEDRGRVLLSIRGSQAWFQALRHTHFPAIMAWQTNAQWPMVAVIAASWSFAHQECLELIGRYWLPYSDKDELTWHALSQIDRWDDASVEMICKVIRRAAGTERLWWAEDVVYKVSADQTALAPRVFEAIVNRPTHVDAETTSRSPLENGNDWHDLPAVAEAAPVEFLRAAWPWFVRVVQRCHTSAPSSVLNEYGGHCMALDRDIACLRYPLLEAILLAVKGCARLEPKAFVGIVKAACPTENQVIHRVLAAGFAELAGQSAGVALEYLLADPRRFLLGSYRNGQADSAALVEAIAVACDDSSRRALENAIISWAPYRSAQEIDEVRDKYAREWRLRLLAAIPEQLLSETTAALVREEKIALPEWNREVSWIRSGGIREIPSLSKDQIRTATDDEVLAALRGPTEPDRCKSRWIPEEKCWEQPGGARAVTRELTELAKEDIGRVLPLLPKLLAEGNESPVAGILDGISNLDLPGIDVVALVRQLAQYGPKSEELCSTAAYLLYRACDRNNGLPDVMARDPWPENEKPTADRDSESRSILWGETDRVIFDSSRSFWPLLALSHGFLDRKPPATDQWLRAHLRLLEFSIPCATWRYYCWQLRWVSLEEADPALAVEVIKKLFQRYPALANTEEGIRLVAMIADSLPPDFVQEFLANLKKSPRPKLQQAYGEVLTFLANWREKHPWSATELSEVMTELQSNFESHASVAVGIAFAAAHIWDDSRSRPEACKLLCQLIPRATADVANAINTVFWAVDDFAADQYTSSLLDCIGSNPHVLVDQCVSDLVEHAANLLPHCRPQVLRLAQTLVNSKGRGLTVPSQALFWAAPHLVSIAMTLQRFEDTRSRGLDLLEELLHLGVGDAFTSLNDIDIRPASPHSNLPRARRRRRRRTA